MSLSNIRLPLFAALAAALLSSSIELAAQAGTGSERFRAFAVNTDSTVGQTGAQTVEIVVDRWSTEAETSRLLETLQTQARENCSMRCRRFGDSAISARPTRLVMNCTSHAKLRAKTVASTS